MQNWILDLKKFILVALTCTSIGYFSGRNPNFSWNAFKQADPKIIIISQSKDLIPEKLLVYIQKRSLIQVDIKIPETDKEWLELIWQADIILSDTERTKKSQEILGKGPLHRWLTKKTKENVSPDFIISQFSSNGTLPLFWSIDNQKLSLFHLWAAPRGSSDPNLIARFIDQIIEREVQLNWLSIISKNTTLRTLDTADIDSKRKSTALRLFDLKNITVY